MTQTALRQAATPAISGQPAMGPGRLVATILAGAWRQTLEPLHVCPDSLARVTPLLLQAGTGALAWWRIRHTELGACRSALPLQQAFRYQSLQAALSRDSLAQAVTLLRSLGVEPLLAKGWAVARLYPKPGLRLCGDIDLCVRPEEYASAGRALSAADDLRGQVDLHRGLEQSGFSFLNDRSLDDLYDRSRVLPLGEGNVRVFGPEDHLRLVCLHMLGHGATRPLWLCDVAVALENRLPDFDWDWFLGGDRRRAEWVVTALGLAHHLLGARLDDTPVAERAARLPRWLVPAVLRSWGSGFRPNPRSTGYGRPMIEVLRTLPRCWRNPVEATIEVNARFNEWPRLPFQVAALARRTGRYLVRLPRW